MKYHILYLLVLYGAMGYTQTKISGTVMDSLGIPITNATVTIKTLDTHVIIAYGITDELGGFSTEVNTSLKEVSIEVLYLGYKSWKKSIPNQEAYFEIIMQESIEELKEVILKMDPVNKRGDTIAYAVSAFKNHNDRTIADVIEKMPGIAILPTGQITYMGEPIEKYYIEGMDLLEGRYSLANESISANDVSQVEILENHQSIKVLDSLIGSERTSINIKLKNNISLSGKAEIGSGFSPGLLKVGITPLLFSKNRQTFASYQYNNTGHDLASFDKDFSTSQSLLSEFNTSKTDLLDVQQLRKPPFSAERWLDNNDHYGTVNHLERLKRELELKVNLSYLNGLRDEFGSQTSTYINPMDSLDYFEEINNTYLLHSLHSKIILERNTHKNYLKNELSSQVYWDSRQGFINNNTSAISQELSNPFWNLKNHLHIIKPIGKQLIEINSKTGLVRAAQELLVTPGPFIEFFNADENYDWLKQQVEYNTFYSDNNAGFTKKIGVFTLSPAMGFSYRMQQLKSKIDTSVSNDDLLESSNDYELNNTTTFITNKLEYKDKIWRITVQTPLFLRNFRISEYYIGTTPITFEPSVFVSKKLSPYWETRLSGKITNSFGDAKNLHNGYILKSYRNLVRYDPVLSRQIRQNASASLQYRNALKAVFGSLSVSYTNNKNNLMFDYQITPEGGITIESVERDNYRTSKNISLNASKYIEKWRTTLSGSGSYYISEQDQVVNNIFNRFKTQGQQYSFKVDINAKEWVTIKMESVFRSLQLNSNSINFDRVNNWNSSIATFFYLNKKQSLNFDIEHYYNNIQSNQNVVFLNTRYQYSLKNYPIDLRLTWNNMLNTKNYVNIQNRQYYNLQSLYVIRPSQILLTVLFTL